MTGIDVRRATEGDLDLVVWAMVTAATSHLERGVWDVVLGTDPATTRSILGRTARSGTTHWCHLDRVLVAEVDGVGVGAATSHDPQAEGNDALAEAVLSVLTPTDLASLDVDGILARSVVLDGCTPKPYVDAWGIENVAVRPAHRGRGVVEALFAAARAEAVGHGREHLQIMCLDGNGRARRTWERNGFTHRAAYRGRAFSSLFGCGGMDLLVDEL